MRTRGRCPIARRRSRWPAACGRRGRCRTPARPLCWACATPPARPPRTCSRCASGCRSRAPAAAPGTAASGARGEGRPAPRRGWGSRGRSRPLGGSDPWGTAGRGRPARSAARCRDAAAAAAAWEPRPGRCTSAAAGRSREARSWCPARCPPRVDLAGRKDTPVRQNGQVATMADLDELAMAMPETVKELSDDGGPSYLVHGKMFCFHRGRRPDAIDPDTGERMADVLMFRVAGLEEKELQLSDARDIYFTTPHFNGYPAVLVRIPDL